MYENLIEVGEASRVRSDESYPTSVIESLINDIRNQMRSNRLVDEATLGLELLVQEFDDYTVKIIEPITSLSVTYPKLID